MKYINAADVLPAELLAEIQRHVEARVIYVPRRTRRRAWGDVNGSREQLHQRNCEIVKKYHAGHNLANLADEYHLAEESLRKIILQIK